MNRWLLLPLILFLAGCNPTSQQAEWERMTWKVLDLCDKYEKALRKQDELEKRIEQLEKQLKIQPPKSNAKPSNLCPKCGVYEIQHEDIGVCPNCEAGNPRFTG